MDEFSNLVDELIGRNGQEANTDLIIKSELSRIFPDGDFSKANREDIDDLLDDDKICAWIAKTGFYPIGFAWMGWDADWTLIHEMLGKYPPQVSQVLEKRLSSNPYTRIYSLLIFREEELILWGEEVRQEDLNLLASLIVDSDVDVQVEALSCLGTLIGSKPIIEEIENHISNKGVDESVEILFFWFRRFIDGNFITDDDYEDEVDCTWQIHEQDVWSEVATHFSSML